MDGIYYLNQLHNLILLMLRNGSHEKFSQYLKHGFYSGYMQFHLHHVVPLIIL